MKRKKRELISDDEYLFILKNYHQMSCTELARRLNRPRTSIQGFLKRHNLDPKNRMYIPLDEDDHDIIKNEKISSYESAKIIGCSDTLVRYHRLKNS